MQVSLNIPQTEFLSISAKFRAFVAGFGSGKTFVGCASQCIHYLEHPKVNQGYFAPTYPLIRDIFYPTADEVAHMFGMKTKAKLGDKEVDYYVGSQYRGTTICRTMDNPANIVGFKVGRALVDELDVLKADKAKAAWQKIIARLRWANVQNGIDVTTTPEGFRFTYERFVEQGGDKYGFIQASTYQNELNLPDDYIESLFETYPAELIEAYINGQFVNLTSGTVYYAFNRNTNKSTEQIKPNEPLHIGMDFNVGKMAAIIHVKRGNDSHAVGEIMNVFDTPAMIEVIKRECPDHRIYVYPDSSGDNRKTVGANKTDISLLSDAGFSVVVDKRNPPVKDRVNAMNAAFRNAKQETVYYVNTHNCPVYTRCLEQQAYDNYGAPDKTKDDDHGNDAGGYYIAKAHPIEKPVSNNHGIRWTR